MNAHRSHWNLLCTAILALVFLFVGTPDGAALDRGSKSIKTLAKTTASTLKSPKAQNYHLAKATRKATKKTRKKNVSKSTRKTPKASRREEAEKLAWPQNIQHLLGSNGAVLVLDPHAGAKGPKELYALNAESSFIPASILKIVTTGAALEFLGPDFRFKTEFYLTPDLDLWISGYGDPYLVSEEVAFIAGQLARAGLKEIRHLGVDNSFFSPGLILDGNSQTRNPYDAYNCALSVNFNTVLYKKDRKGVISESDNQTPLTPTTLELAGKHRERGEVHMNIYESPQKAEQHAGELFRAYLEKAGVSCSGQIITGRTVPANSRHIYTHLSPMTLEAMTRELLKYSNNYITNQIFLTMGAEIYGAPATLEKSQMVMVDYFAKHGLPAIDMSDGSGLSRQTTLTARQMAAVLEVFEPDRHLLSVGRKNLSDTLSKTGTMTGIHTLAGYIERPDAPDNPLSFVILHNGPDYEVGAREAVLEMIASRFARSAAPAAGH